VEELVVVSVTYRWDFEFQGKFELLSTGHDWPYFAIAGSLLHEDFNERLTKEYEGRGLMKLVTRRDFRLSRDRGFSLGRAIRGVDGRAVQVMDQKRRKPMRALPDVVDYTTDTVIDLKTHHLREPPHKGGILLTLEDFPGAIPGDASPPLEDLTDNYIDAWPYLKADIEKKLEKQYGSQLQRYHDAYVLATGRSPSLNVYVVLFARTGTYYSQAATQPGARLVDMGE
jgi:hypothetical protein